MSGSIDPALKKLLQIQSGRLLERRAQIPAGCRSIAMGIVVSAQATEESVIAQAAAQHVQHPRALFIVVRIQQLEKVRSVTVMDWCAASFLVLEITFGGTLHIRAKRIFAFVALQKESGEISSKSFTQPKVGPG